MTTYRMEDLEIVDDPIPTIRRRADWYAGEKPRGPRLLTRLARDLLIMKVAPIRLDQLGEWWSIYASDDWLTAVDGKVSFDTFKKITHFPESGRLAIRTEIVIAALAEAVVTIGIDGQTWLVGDSNSWSLPAAMVLAASGMGRGRYLAFVIAD